MKIPQPVIMIASGGITSAATMFLNHSMVVMLPWFITLFVFVLADLSGGRYKSHKLAVHFAWSTAIRESLGKIVVYLAGVLAFAMVDVAAKGNLVIAKWCCLLLCAVEGGSFVSNILAPHGIRLSLKGIIKLFLKRSPLSIGDEEVEEIIKAARREDMKWNRRKYTSDKRKNKTDKNSFYDSDGTTTTTGCTDAL